MSLPDLPPAESLDANVASTSGSVSSAGVLAADGSLPTSDDVETGKKSSKTGLFVFIGVAVAALALFGLAFAPSRNSVAITVDSTHLIANPEGMAAPVFSGNKLDGTGKTGLADYRGKVVVVNFWASWCGPCQAEGAVLAAAQKRWADKGVVFIGVDSKDASGDAKKFEQKYGMAYTSIEDPNGQVAPHYGVTGFPETYFVSKSGVVVGKYISTIDAASIDSQIAAALQSA